MRIVDVGGLSRRPVQLDDATGRLEMDLFLMPQGTARPEEVLSLVGLDGLIADGVSLERVGLELKQPDSVPGNSVRCSVFSVQ